MATNANTDNKMTGSRDGAPSIADGRIAAHKIALEIYGFLQALFIAQRLPVVKDATTYYLMVDGQL